MNSYETLSVKELKSVEENLMKQLEKVRNERKSRSSDSTTPSIFKISLFSSKEDKNDKEKVKAAEKEKAKAEKEKEKEKAKAEKEKAKAEKEKEKEKAKAEKEKEKAKAEKEKAKEDDDKKPRAIKATIASMKEVLDYHHVDYPSNAKKDDLAKLLRENNLVREAEKKESNKKAD